MASMPSAAAKDCRHDSRMDVLLETEGNTQADASHSEDIEVRGSVVRSLQGVKQGVAITLFLVLGVVLFCYAALVATASPRSTAVAVIDHPGTEMIEEWWQPPPPPPPWQPLSFNDWVRVKKVEDGKFRGLLYNVYANHPTFLHEKAEMDSLVQWQFSRNCPMQSLNANILTGILYRQLDDAKTPAHCQKACTETIMPKCAVWSFQMDGHLCKLKLFNAERHQKRVNHHGMLSGYPCQENQIAVWWPMHDQDFYKMPQPAVPAVITQPARCKVTPDYSHCDSTGGDCCAPMQFEEKAECSGGLVPVREIGECDGWKDGRFTCCHDKDITPEPTHKMLCVVLFMAYSYEQELLIMQHKQKAGIFQCDSHVIYSSQVIELVPGLVSRRIPSSMRAEPGGQFCTVLNLGVFLSLYRQMISDRDYLKADWLIKVDPDTVFFPHRLRPLLRSYSWGVGGAGIYLNNCPEGLHGPVEILSQNAFLSFAKGVGTCYTNMNDMECSLKCQKRFEGCVGKCTEWWGEDIFLDQCLERFTKTRRVFAKQLLQEDHCPTNQRKGWDSCEDTTVSSFHPFKDPPKWLHCWKAALKQEGIKAKFKSHNHIIRTLETFAHR